MDLLLKRIARKDKYTIGKLYCDGVYVCDTIEDKDRLYLGLPKVKGATAIPCGTYEITQNVKSPRFGNNAFYKEVCGGFLPRLLNVPMFDGVLIHTGNTEKDTDGCILVGYNKTVGSVSNSRDAFRKLMNNYLIPAKKRGEKVYITIK